MGCDIHGTWELFHPVFNRWVSFKPINDSRSYAWFGIIAGVRDENRPLVEVTMGRSADPIHAKEESFSRMWTEYCRRWGRGLHSHAILPWHSVIAANEIMWTRRQRDRLYEEVTDAHFTHEPNMDRIIMSYHEDVPDADFLVESVIVEMRPGQNEWGEDAQLPIELPMGVTLGDILGSTDTEVIGDRVRMVVAFDN